MANELKNILENAIDGNKKVELSAITGAVDNMIGDEEIKIEMSLTPDMVFNLKSDPVLGFKVEIKDGKPSVSCDLSSEPDFSIDIPQGTLKAMVSGEKDVMTPFMGGEIAMWQDGNLGDMQKAMDLMPLITAVADNMDLKI